MSVGVMEDYKLRDLRASHTLYLEENKKKGRAEIETFFFLGEREEMQGFDFIKGSFFFHEIPMKFHEKQAFH